MNTNFRIKIVVSENFSNDNSLEILQKYRSQITIIQPQEHLPIAEHWNFLSSYARGDYIKFLCADDVLTPGSLGLQFELLEKNLEAGLVVNKREIINENGRVLISKYGAKLPEGLVDGKRAFYQSWRAGTNIFGEPGSILFRYKFFDLGLPWESEELYMLDMSHYRKSFITAKILISHKVCSAFRVHSNSLSSKMIDIQEIQFKSFFRRYINENGQSDYFKTRNRIISSLNSKKINISRKYFFKALDNSIVKAFFDRKISA